jgi:hypothetical protein
MGGELAKLKVSNSCTSDIKCCGCNDDETGVGIDINLALADEQVTLDAPATPSEFKIAPSAAVEQAGTRVNAKALNRRRTDEVMKLGLPLPMVRKLNQAAAQSSEREVTTLEAEEDGIAFVEVDLCTARATEHEETQPTHRSMQSTEVPKWPPEVTGAPEPDCERLPAIAMKEVRDVEDDESCLAVSRFRTQAEFHSQRNLVQSARSRSREDGLSSARREVVAAEKFRSRLKEEGALSARSGPAEFLRLQSPETISLTSSSSTHGGLGMSARSELAGRGGLLSNEDSEPSAPQVRTLAESFKSKLLEEGITSPRGAGVTTAEAHRLRLRDGNLLSARNAARQMNSNRDHAKRVASPRRV